MTKQKQLSLWIRLGDAGENENHGQDFSALVDNLYEHRIEPEDIDWLLCPRNPELYIKRNNLPYLPSAGFNTPVYSGNNYVSLFWGDVEGNLVQPLTKAEQKDIDRRLVGLQLKEFGFRLFG